MDNAEIIPAARLEVSGYNCLMDFFPPDANIERVPPADMRFLDLIAQPEINGKRIKVFLEITPFEHSPFIDLFVNDSQGNVVASTSIIEPAAWKFKIIIHSRQSEFSTGEYRLHAILYHPEYGEMDYRKITFSIPDVSK